MLFTETPDLFITLAHTIAGGFWIARLCTIIHSIGYVLRSINFRRPVCNHPDHIICLRVSTGIYICLRMDEILEKRIQKP